MSSKHPNPQDRFPAVATPLPPGFRREKCSKCRYMALCVARGDNLFRMSFAMCQTCGGIMLGTAIAATISYAETISAISIPDVRWDSWDFTEARVPPCKGYLFHERIASSFCPYCQADQEAREARKDWERKRRPDAR